MKMLPVSSPVHASLRLPSCDLNSVHRADLFFLGGSGLRYCEKVTDPTIELTNANAVWALCEPTIAVMVCALPTYRSLLSRKKSPAPTSYANLVQTRSTGKSGDSRSTSVPHELDMVSGHSLHSTASQTALRPWEHSSGVANVLETVHWTLGIRKIEVNEHRTLSI